jgi:hypothetical protein
VSDPPRRLSRGHARLAVALLGLAAAPAAPAVAQGPDDEEIGDDELNALLDQIGQESAPGDAEDVGQPPEADNVNGPEAVEESPELNNQPEAITVPPAPPEESVAEPPPPAPPAAPAAPQAPPPVEPTPPAPVANPVFAPLPTSPVPPPPAPATAPVPAPPEIELAPPAADPPARQRSQPQRRPAGQSATPHTVSSAPPAASAPPPAAAQPAPEPVPPSSAPQAPAVYTAAANEMLAAGRGGVYVVKAGDTLWEIAQALLGPGASSAEIAREVSRLWRRNGDRIASGSPDLIRPGERLVLG